MIVETNLQIVAVALTRAGIGRFAERSRADKIDGVLAEGQAQGGIVLTVDDERHTLNDLEQIRARGLDRNAERLRDRFLIIEEVTLKPAGQNDRIADGEGDVLAADETLHISQEEVRRAQQRIRQLDPRPGRQFSPPEPAPMVYPDVFVVEQEGEFVCDDHRRPAPMLHLNRYYQDLYRQTDDPEVKKYLAEKLVQAENVLFALRQRESTMLRCARFVAAGQQAFFRDGPRALRPMYMTEAAQALDVHLSTVSRAVKDKYLQCRQGVFPLNYFFSAPAPDGSDVSRRAVLLQLRELIDGEDKAHPLSDEKLRCLLEQKGCVLSRRTVAKYREELGIPGTAGRRE